MWFEMDVVSNFDFDLKKLKIMLSHEAEILGGYLLKLPLHHGEPHDSLAAQ